LDRKTTGNGQGASRYGSPENCERVPVDGVKTEFETCLTMKERDKRFSITSFVDDLS
jgi:hypothetical protein